MQHGHRATVLSKKELLSQQKFVPSLQIFTSPKAVLDLVHNESREKQVWDFVGNHSRREFILYIVDDPVRRI